MRTRGEPEKVLHSLGAFENRFFQPNAKTVRELNLDDAIIVPKTDPVPRQYRTSCRPSSSVGAEVAFGTVRRILIPMGLRTVATHSGINGGNRGGNDDESLSDRLVVSGRYTNL